MLAGAWRAAFAAEAAAFRADDSAQMLLDLAKAFETVPLGGLVRAAVAHGYPLALLRLSLAAYAAPRSIGMDGVWSREVQARRGITAGSGFATTELRVLFWSLMLQLSGQFPASLRVTVFVDDVMLGCSGSPAHVFATLVSATDHPANHEAKVVPPKGGLGDGPPCKS